jgi:hypothetical protein
MKTSIRIQLFIRCDFYPELNKNDSPIEATDKRPNQFCGPCEDEKVHMVREDEKLLTTA